MYVDIYGLALCKSFPILQQESLVKSHIRELQVQVCNTGVVLVSGLPGDFRKHRDIGAI